MKISVALTIIVIHRNNINNLINFFKSLGKELCLKNEVIVIDNKSTPENLQKIKELKGEYFFKLIDSNFNLGFGSACNLGMRLANNSYFLLCNDDIQLNKKIINQFCTYFTQYPELGLIGPQQLDKNGNRVRSYSLNKSHFFSQFDLIGRCYKNIDIKSFSVVDCLRGACLGVNSKMFHELGGYDEDFFLYHEETEWCFRINKSNKWKVFYAPEIIIYHFGGSTTSKDFSKSRIEFFRSRMLFWQKTLPFKKRLTVIVWNFSKLFVDLFFYLFMSTISLGLNKKFRLKFIDRLVVIIWILARMPKKWGLSDKKT